MSWCKCQVCYALIDSDADPDCFVEITNMKRLTVNIILCERCRDEREAAHEAEMDAASRAEAMAENQGGE